MGILTDDMKQVVSEQKLRVCPGGLPILSPKGSTGDDVPGLQDGVGLARERGLQVVRGADPGQPRPHDQHVDVLRHRDAACRDRSRFSSPSMTS